MIVRTHETVDPHIIGGAHADVAAGLSILDREAGCRGQIDIAIGGFGADRHVLLRDDGDGFARCHDGIGNSDIIGHIDETGCRGQKYVVASDIGQFDAIVGADVDFALTSSVRVHVARGKAAQ